MLGREVVEGQQRVSILAEAVSRLLVFGRVALDEGVERELGASIGDLSREDKQRAVRLLEERGAFTLRRAVEDVADALAVSRITVYNYLNAMRSEPVRRV